MFGKYFFYPVIIFMSFNLAACSTNPATGQTQFTGLMSPQQETSIGAQEHSKIIKQNPLYNDPQLQNYVQTVGNRVVKNTERSDVNYQFFLLDSPVVNAFALPGGYIYLTRGLMALSNNEAEMAAVLAHEAGHITGRHSAERYSRGLVTTLGAAILSAAVGSDGVSQVLGLGNDLYIKSYSRGQENQADGLGIRYLSRAGYDPRAMSGFLSNLNADSQLEAALKGKDHSQSTDYFSTHPATAERISLASQDAGNYPAQGDVSRDAYLRRIDSMTYGDSAAQGFVRGQTFYHTKIGFTFTAPPGYEIMNQPEQVIAVSPSGAAIVFDMVKNPDRVMPMDYLEEIWAHDQVGAQAETIEINGMRAATAIYDGAVNGKPMRIRLIVIAWGPAGVARFMIATPSSVSGGEIEALKRSTHSFRRLSAEEQRAIRPYRLKVITAGPSDTVGSMASRMALPDQKEARFRVLNGLNSNDRIVSGALYKIVTD